VAFSALWFALVFSVGSSTASGTTVNVLAGLLLVVYPISDAVATMFDLRSDRTGQSRLLQGANVASSGTAALAVVTAAFADLTAAIDAFAV
jgi:hypothetical protein